MSTSVLGWPGVPLVELTSKIGSGATPRGGKSSYLEDGIALIRSLNVYDLTFEWDQLARISEKQAFQLDNVVVERGDILLNITGASVARCCCVPREVLPARVNQHVSIIRPKPERLDGRFLAYYLTSYNGKGRLLAIAQGGATREALTKGKIEAFTVPVPSLRIQRKIASILSAYDDLIENNLRRIQILEEMAQALYREWFVEFRFPGHEEQSSTRQERDRLAPGWDEKVLSEVAELVMGQSPKSEYYNMVGDGLPFHQGVTDFGDRFPSNRVYCTVANRVAERGDILFSVRAPVGRINVAATRMVVGRGLSAIRSLADCQWFLFHQLKELFYEEDTMGGGTIFKAVTKKDMQGIKLVWPDSAVIERFDALCRPMEAAIENLTRQCAVLRETRDLLLPKLISGEVDVSDLTIDVGQAA